MTLRTKTLLFVTLTVAALFAAMIAGARTLVLGGFDALEAKEASDTDADVASILGTMVAEFVERPADWSDWDDLAVYASDGASDFEEANLTPDSFASVQWDHIIVLRADRSRVFSAQLDRGTRTLVPTSKDLDGLIDRGVLAPDGDNERSFGGFVMLEGRLALIASRGVHKTDHSPGPVPARLITSRFVDDAWMARLRKFTFLDIHFLPIGAPAPDAVASRAARELSLGAEIHAVTQESSITTFSRMTDVAGRAIFDVRIEQPRRLRFAATGMLGAISWGLGAAGVAFALFAALALGRGVVTPLRSVLGGVRRLEAGEKAVVPVTSRDEVGELAGAFNRMAEKIVEREGELALVLDSAGDGLVLLGLGGEVQGRISAPLLAWFGPPGGRPIWEWLPLDADGRAWFRLGLEQLASDVLPMELLIDQLPRELVAGDRTFRLGYQPVHAHDALRNILLVIHDATTEVVAERAQRDTRELQAIAGHYLRDRAAFSAFVEECEQLVAELGEDGSLEERRRALHTLKGNTAIYGLEAIAELIHQGEDRIDADAAVAPEVAGEVAAAWHEARARIERVFNTGDDGKIQLEPLEYERFLRDLTSKASTADLVAEVRSWRNVRTRDILGRLALQVERAAQKTGKTVEVEIVDPGLRVPREDLGPFFGALVHVVRNAVDHGIEEVNERRASAKPERGRIKLIAERTAQRFAIEVSDDGRGINWDRVRRAAAKRGVAVQTETQLVHALFADGVTTKDEVTPLSGRGVGLAAVLETLKRAGGEVHVRTQHGSGTTFRFEVPLSGDTPHAQAA